MCKYIDILKREIKQIQLYLSANIIKNALGIGIPGIGKIGIEIAAVLGGVIKKSEKKLEILYNFIKDELEKANEIVDFNEIKLHLKEYMGRLSPLCGAGIAGATGACCGMTYLQGETLENIKRAINNMLADLSGLICDGAKTSCVLKIATATNPAIQCSTSSNTIPSSKDGIVFDDVEETIKSIAKLVKEGLANTDNK